MRDQYAMLRPKGLGPFLAVWSAGFVVAGVVSANDPRYGPWYLLAEPVAYAAGQWMFRMMRNVEIAGAIQLNLLALDGKPACWSEDNVGTIAHRTGSTDMGDLAQVMPIIHPYVGGASGTSHGADFEISDPNLIYVTNAKALAAMAVDLLADGGGVGKEVLARSKPPMTRAGYLEFQRGMSRQELYEG